MGGGHDHPPYKVPDHTVFKLENAPELMRVKEKLAKKGLSDPWLRNEVWRFDRRMWPTEGQNIRALFSRGLGIGVALFAITVGIEQAIKFASKDDGHGHGHH